MPAPVALGGEAVGDEGLVGRDGVVGEGGPRAGVDIGERGGTVRVASCSRCCCRSCSAACRRARRLSARSSALRRSLDNSAT